MREPYQEIVEFLQSHQIPFTQSEHTAVFTAIEATNVINVPLHTGAKALLFKAEVNFILIVIPGDKKLSSKKLKSFLKIKRLRFATPEEVEKIMHCQIGSCYPFGNLVNVPMYVDMRITDNDYITFNPGIHTKSIKLQWKDYERIMKPTLIDVSE